MLSFSYSFNTPDPDYAQIFLLVGLPTALDLLNRYENTKSAKNNHQQRNHSHTNYTHDKLELQEFTAISNILQTRIFLLKIIRQRPDTSSNQSAINDILENGQNLVTFVQVFLLS